MANSPVFQEFGKDVLARGTAEIGMHLHAWDSPPLVPLTVDDNRYHPFLIEYPEDQMREKIRVMTATLEDIFGVKMISHRAGRWGFDHRYAQILSEQGYCVDCSVTPHMSWSTTRGDPSGNGGPDFSRFPDTSYFLDLSDIRRPGTSDLLEIPVTVILHQYPRIVDVARSTLRMNRFGTRVANRLFPPTTWLYPDVRRHKTLRRILARARQDGRPYVELAMHSSELMPGGSPAFPSQQSIESLYDILEELFADALHGFKGQTLGEYYHTMANKQSAGSGAALLRSK